MPVPVNSKYSRQRGAALLVVAAVAVIAGVMMTLGIGAFRRQEPVDLRFLTLAREEFLIDQIASYVHRTRELPCPAAPDRGAANFGTERGACTGADAHGIIPFRTLNIDERYARDAWGRYFTYAISPVFANPTNANDANIYHRCRTDRWVNDEDNIAGPGAPAPRNENPQKARFCCPPSSIPTTDDLVINDADGNNWEPAPGFDERDTAPPSAFGDINSVGPSPANTSATAFAVVIVSHGSNGAGAYTGNGANDRFPAGVGDELENANGDNTYVNRSMATEPGAGYFDDIVIHRTQTALYSELNNASCFRPWR